MDAESFQDNGFVVVRSALDQDLVSFINNTWDQLKKPPYIEAFDFHFPLIPYSFLLPVMYYILKRTKASIKKHS